MNNTKQVAQNNEESEYTGHVQDLMLEHRGRFSITVMQRKKIVCTSANNIRWTITHRNNELRDGFLVR